MGRVRGSQGCARRALGLRGASVGASALVSPPSVASAPRSVHADVQGVFTRVSWRNYLLLVLLVLTVSSHLQSASVMQAGASDAAHMASGAAMDSMAMSAGLSTAEQQRRANTGEGVDAAALHERQQPLPKPMNSQLHAPVDTDAAGSVARSDGRRPPCAWIGEQQAILWTSPDCEMDASMRRVADLSTVWHSAGLVGVVNMYGERHRAGFRTTLWSDFQASISGTSRRTEDDRFLRGEPPPPMLRFSMGSALQDLMNSLIVHDDERQFITAEQYTLDGCEKGASGMASTEVTLRSISSSRSESEEGSKTDRASRSTGATFDAEHHLVRRPQIEQRRSPHEVFARASLMTVSVRFESTWTCTPVFEDVVLRNALEIDVEIISIGTEVRNPTFDIFLLNDENESIRGLGRTHKTDAMPIRVLRQGASIRMRAVYYPLAAGGHTSHAIIRTTHFSLRVNLNGEAIPNPLDLPCPISLVGQHLHQDGIDLVTLRQTVFATRLLPLKGAHLVGVDEVRIHSLDLFSGVGPKIGGADNAVSRVDRSTPEPSLIPLPRFVSRQGAEPLLSLSFSPAPQAGTLVSYLHLQFGGADTEDDATGEIDIHQSDGFHVEMVVPVVANFTLMSANSSFTLSVQNFDILPVDFGPVLRSEGEAMVLRKLVVAVGHRPESFFLSNLGFSAPPGARVQGVLFETWPLAPRRLRHTETCAILPSMCGQHEVHEADALYAIGEVRVKVPSEVRTRLDTAGCTVKAEVYDSRSAAVQRIHHTSVGELHMTTLRGTLMLVEPFFEACVLCGDLDAGSESNRDSDILPPERDSTLSENVRHAGSRSGERRRRRPLSVLNAADVPIQLLRLDVYDPCSMLDVLSFENALLLPGEERVVAQYTFQRPTRNIGGSAQTVPPHAIIHKCLPTFVEFKTNVSSLRAELKVSRGNLRASHSRMHFEASINHADEALATTAGTADEGKGILWNLSNPNGFAQQLHAIELVLLDDDDDTDENEVRSAAARNQNMAYNVLWRAPVSEALQRMPSSLVRRRSMSERQQLLLRSNRMLADCANIISIRHEHEHDIESERDEALPRGMDENSVAVILEPGWTVQFRLLPPLWSSAAEQEVQASADSAGASTGSAAVPADRDSLPFGVARALLVVRYSAFRSPSSSDMSADEYGDGQMTLLELKVPVSVTFHSAESASIISSAGEDHGSTPTRIFPGKLLHLQLAGEISLPEAQADESEGGHVVSPGVTLFAGKRTGPVSKRSAAGTHALLVQGRTLPAFRHVVSAMSRIADECFELAGIEGHSNIAAGLCVAACRALDDVWKSVPDELIVRLGFTAPARGPASTLLLRTRKPSLLLHSGDVIDTMHMRVVPGSVAYAYDVFAQNPSDEVAMVQVSLVCLVPSVGRLCKNILQFKPAEEFRTQGYGTLQPSASASSPSSFSPEASREAADQRRKVRLGTLFYHPISGLSVAAQLRVISNLTGLETRTIRIDPDSVAFTIADRTGVARDLDLHQSGMGAAIAPTKARVAHVSSLSWNFLFFPGMSRIRDAQNVTSSAGLRPARLRNQRSSDFAVCGAQSVRFRNLSPLWQPLSHISVRPVLHASLHPIESVSIGSFATSSELARRRMPLALFRLGAASRIPYRRVEAGQEAELDVEFCMRQELFEKDPRMVSGNLHSSGMLRTHWLLSAQIGVQQIHVHLFGKVARATGGHSKLSRDGFWRKWLAWFGARRMCVRRFTRTGILAGIVAAVVQCALVLLFVVAKSGQQLQKVVLEQARMRNNEQAEARSVEARSVEALPPKAFQRIPGAIRTRQDETRAKVSELTFNAGESGVIECVSPLVVERAAEVGGVTGWHSDGYRVGECLHAAERVQNDSVVPAAHECDAHVASSPVKRSEGSRKTEGIPASVKPRHKLSAAGEDESSSGSKAGEVNNGANRLQEERRFLLQQRSRGHKSDTTVTLLQEASPTVALGGRSYGRGADPAIDEAGNAKNSADENIRARDFSASKEKERREQFVPDGQPQVSPKATATRPQAEERKFVLQQRSRGHKNDVTVTILSDSNPLSSPHNHANQNKMHTQPRPAPQSLSPLNPHAGDLRQSHLVSVNKEASTNVITRGSRGRGGKDNEDRVDAAGSSGRGQVFQKHSDGRSVKQQQQQLHHHHRDRSNAMVTETANLSNAMHSTRVFESPASGELAATTSSPSQQQRTINKQWNAANGGSASRADHTHSGKKKVFSSVLSDDGGVGSAAVDMSGSSGVPGQAISSSKRGAVPSLSTATLPRAPLGPFHVLPSPKETTSGSCDTDRTPNASFGSSGGSGSGGGDSSAWRGTAAQSPFSSPLMSNRMHVSSSPGVRVSPVARRDAPWSGASARRSPTLSPDSAFITKKVGSGFEYPGSASTIADSAYQRHSIGQESFEDLESARLLAESMTNMVVDSSLSLGSSLFSDANNVSARTDRAIADEPLNSASATSRNSSGLNIGMTVRSTSATPAYTAADAALPYRDMLGLGDGGGLSTASSAAPAPAFASEYSLFGPSFVPVMTQVTAVDPTAIVSPSGTGIAGVPAMPSVVDHPATLDFGLQSSWLARPTAGASLQTERDVRGPAPAPSRQREEQQKHRKTTNYKRY
ncbi:hypothetical protein FVE85_6244 [Porphyridium purpureum]|uniref:Uncharacterized protein n=1 Tax=Porphyridium purpureum TaxID=35688 RepID=A0A5J4Z3U3_PORPP|nr:hypothetical protein FVE85_6244 [Porphyridium purpureum]|eukprot:POR3956..scf295_1